MHGVLQQVGFMVFSAFKVSKVALERLQVNMHLFHRKSTITEHFPEDILFVKQTF